MLGPHTLLNNLEARGITLRVSPQDGPQIVAGKGSMSPGDVKWIRKFHSELIEILSARNAIKFQADNINSVIHGNNLDILPLIPDNSVDAIVSDPPYGYGFMGKTWDKPVPVTTLEILFPKLKPGGWIIIISSPRQDVQLNLLNNLKDAGFEMNFSPIY